MSAHSENERVEPTDGLRRNAGDVSFVQRLGTVNDPACALWKPLAARSLVSEKFFAVHPCSDPSNPNVWVEKTGVFVSAPRRAGTIEEVGFVVELAVSVKGTPAVVAPPR